MSEIEHKEGVSELGILTYCFLKAKTGVGSELMPRLIESRLSIIWDFCKMAGILQRLKNGLLNMSRDFGCVR